MLILIGSSGSTLITKLLTLSDFDLNSKTQRFCQQQEPPSYSTWSNEEHFSSTHSKNVTGRYWVRLPFKLYHAQLGNHVANSRISRFGNTFSTLSITSKVVMSNSWMNEHFDSCHTAVCEWVHDDNNYFLRILAQHGGLQRLVRQPNWERFSTHQVRPQLVFTLTI